MDYYAFSDSDTEDDGPSEIFVDYEDGVALEKACDRVNKIHKELIEYAKHNGLPIYNHPNAYKNLLDLLISSRSLESKRV